MEIPDEAGGSETGVGNLAPTDNISVRPARSAKFKRRMGLRDFAGILYANTNPTITIVSRCRDRLAAKQQLHVNGLQSDW